MGNIYFEDLRVGEFFWGDEVIVDPGEMLAYGKQNDPWPIHIDEDAAASSPFDGIIASGGYSITLMYRSLIGAYNTPERRWQFLGGFDWKLKFENPVRAGDRLRARLSVDKMTPSRKIGRGIVNSTIDVFNQDELTVLSNEIVFLLATRAS